MKNRSLLFVPSNEKMLLKVGTLDADCYVIDLEDSIRTDDKEDALKRLIEFVNRTDIKNRIIVRINKERFKEEICALATYSQLGFMLPKFEEPEYYYDVRDILQEHFAIALVETPKGILFAEQIASQPWIAALAFGAEDYTAKANMRNRNDLLLYPKSQLVTCAKAFGKLVFDTPSFQIKDMDKLNEDVQFAVDLGFDGKLAIHPIQIEAINKTFGYNNIGYFKSIVAQYDALGQAVSTIDGVVYEKMHIERMKRIIREQGE